MKIKTAPGDYDQKRLREMARERMAKLAEKDGVIHMSVYGQIKIAKVGGMEIHTLSFANVFAWSHTETYIRNCRPDLTITDSFWGYALYADQRQAIETINAFAPEA